MSIRVHFRSITDDNYIHFSGNVLKTQANRMLLKYHIDCLSKGWNIVKVDSKVAILTHCFCVLLLVATILLPIFRQDNKKNTWCSGCVPCSSVFLSHLKDFKFTQLSSIQLPHFSVNPCFLDYSYCTLSLR
jgi:hypothetical protein